MTQAELDRKIDAAVAKYSNKRVADENGQYVGQCVSKQKREFRDITGKACPATGTGYADGWLARPGILKDYFNAPVPYNQNTDYPKGSWFFNKATHHAGTYINRQGSGARVFEQNADPDGSSAHLAVRAGNKISHVMTWKVTAPAQTSIGMPAVGSQIRVSGQRTTYHAGTTTVAGSRVFNNDVYTVRGYDPKYPGRVIINSASAGGNGVALALYYTNGSRIAGWSNA